MSAMLDGWYCRSMASEAAAAEEEEQAMEESQCKKQYKFLKRKFKNLLYENECFRDTLRASQKRLLAVTRDRNFLLDRLLQFEKTESTSESEETDSSDEEMVRAASEPNKKRKLESNGSMLVNNNVAASGGGSGSSGGKAMPVPKRKKPMPSVQPSPKQFPQQHQSSAVVSPAKSAVSQPFMPIPMNTLTTSGGGNILSDGHMTPEEVERHLQSRQTYMELMPERTPLTVPTEMFSNEPSLDSESNDVGEMETSPSNMGEELSIDMIPE